MSGGGTGGHIYPALAVAQELRQQQPPWELLYIGARGGMEEKLVAREGLSFAAVPARGLERRLSWAAVAGMASLLPGTWEAARVLQRFRPQVVVGTGGYVCAPVVLAAWLARIPVVLHEQNALPGLTNRYLSRLARAVCTSLPGAEKYFSRPERVRHTGLPVRQEIITMSREEAAARLGLDPRKRFVLAVGGSLGARKINEAMVGVHRELAGSTSFHIMHVTGDSGHQAACEQLAAQGINWQKAGNITIVPYLHEMAAALALAEIVVGRAGATFLAEVMLRGRPAILVPYPFAAENHQEYNARVVEEAGGAVVIPDRELTPAVLWSAVRELLEDGERRRVMGERMLSLARPQAAEEIARVIMQVARR